MQNYKPMGGDIINIIPAKYSFEDSEKVSIGEAEFREYPYSVYYATRYETPTLLLIKIDNMWVRVSNGRFINPENETIFTTLCNKYQTKSYDQYSKDVHQILCLVKQAMAIKYLFDKNIPTEEVIIKLIVEGVINEES